MSVSQGRSTAKECPPASRGFPVESILARGICLAGDTEAHSRARDGFLPGRRIGRAAAVGWQGPAQIRERLPPLYPCHHNIVWEAPSTARPSIGAPTPGDNSTASAQNATKGPPESGMADVAPSYVPPIAERLTSPFREHPGGVGTRVTVARNDLDRADGTFSDPYGTELLLEMSRGNPSNSGAPVNVVDVRA